MEHNITYNLNKNKIKYLVFGIIIFISTLIMAILTAGIGSMNIKWQAILYIIVGKTFSSDFLLNIPENIIAVIWDIRIPRILCAIFTGAGLAVSGCIFQGILQNPLADPYTLGISSGASFGASVAIVLNIILEIYFSVTLFALISSIITLFFVITISKKGNSLESSNLIIAGIIINSFLSSAISFIKTVAGEDVGAIVFWIMGNLSSKSWSDFIIISPTVFICCIISFLLSSNLDIMALGDKNAYSLGINVNKIRFIYLIIGAIITSVCVSCCGVIGFVGLIVPHLLRIGFTAKNTILIPLSAGLGAFLLLTADSISRIIFLDEIPVGVITTLVGGPFFIYIFIKKRRRNRF